MKVAKLRGFVLKSRVISHFESSLIYQNVESKAMMVLVFLGCLIATASCHLPFQIPVVLLPK
jgi:hypothetical protein